MVIGGYQVYIYLCPERDLNPYTLKAMIYGLLLRYVESSCRGMFDLFCMHSETVHMD